MPGESKPGCYGVRMSADEAPPSPIVWMDLEMSGLDPEVERILEIAVLVTDADLRVIAEGPDLIVHQSDDLLARMDAWNTEHHGDSGLTEAVRKSKLSEAEAEAQVLEFLKEHCVARQAPLAGNSIGQDRRFLYRYMPAVSDHLHYRSIDVSTIKELARRWYPDILEQAPVKKGAHRAMDDIAESIEELRFYREAVFRAPQESSPAEP